MVIQLPYLCTDESSTCPESTKRIVQCTPVKNSVFARTDLSLGFLSENNLSQFLSMAMEVLY